MDLTQKKLSKSEWLNIEVPFPEKEKLILQMIVDGYTDEHMRKNETLSLIQAMKLDGSVKGMGEFLYKEYFEASIKKLLTKYSNIVGTYQSPIVDKKVKLKKADMMRISNVNEKWKDRKKELFEFVLLETCTQLLKMKHIGSHQYVFHFYTLLSIRKSHIHGTNQFVSHFLDYVIDTIMPSVSMRTVLQEAHAFIEKNPALLKYEDITLFQHQKDIFRTFRYPPPTSNGNDPFEKIQLQRGVGSKLVLYTAPTGTGKTLTPLGLSQGFRMIFICAARHVGLALAKSAVCMNKRIGIAFGCETADDIRLHYYAASKYSVNQRSGGIGKVDNSVGDKVEIMICDIKSYLIAMRYMISFSPEYPECVRLDANIDVLQSRLEDEEEHDESTSQLQKQLVALQQERDAIVCDGDLITYWDEPTISMDYDEHPLHELISQVWSENVVSKLVLSCATLPQEHEIGDALSSFMSKFPDASVETVASFDCRKSISLLNDQCKSVVPHLLYDKYDELQQCVAHCNENKTLLRYFDLPEILRFIDRVHTEDNVVDEPLICENYFENGIADITMNNIKLYYLRLLKHVKEEDWSSLHSYLLETQKTKIPVKRKTTMVSNNTVKLNVAGLNITTTDAQTLTDGPTIFLAENVENLGKYYIHQANFPPQLYQSIYQRVEYNTQIQEKLTEAENELEYLTEQGTTQEKGDGKKKDKKLARDDDQKKPEIRKLSQLIENLRSRIEIVNLDDVYVPNTNSHQLEWNDAVKESAFRPTISDENVRDIMALDVDNDKKMLLLLGIGVFIDENKANPKYMEIMKKLAYNQQLFVILASSDYIYGTNYQFCHGYIGKDLKKMTQQKTIQAMGRIGRNSMQNDYTVRFRDNDMLYQLFQRPSENKEANIMNQLFTA